MAMANMVDIYLAIAIESINGYGQIDVYHVGLIRYVFQFGNAKFSFHKCNVLNNGGLTDLRGIEARFINCVLRSSTGLAINSGGLLILENSEVYAALNALNVSTFKITNSYIESTTGKGIVSGYGDGSFIKSSRIKSFDVGVEQTGGTYTSGMKLAIYDSKIVVNAATANSIVLLAPVIPASPNKLLLTNSLISKPVQTNANLVERMGTYETDLIVL